MLKNREVADIVKECVLKGGMTRADILQEVRKRGHNYINSAATITDYMFRLRQQGELPPAMRGMNLRYRGERKPPNKPGPATTKPKTTKKPKIQKPRNLEIQKNRKPESKEYRKMTFQLRPDQETELLLYRAKHKLKLSEMVRQALDKFFKKGG